MPIPTDTFWNIRKLNLVFALSAVALFGVTAWAILQDYDKQWRTSQRQARVWETALVDEKIQRGLSDEEKRRLEQLEGQIAGTEAELLNRNQTYEQLARERRKLESDRSTLEFAVNNLKSTVQVDEAHLQDAIAAGDTARVNALTAQLEGPRKRLAQDIETLFQYQEQIAEVRAKMDAQTAEVDALKKERSRLAADVEAMKKKLISLDPARQGGLSGLQAAMSQIIRDAPLLGFVNPSEKVQQIVLPDVQTDVAFMKITTIDRCTTCHVNIARKDFAEEQVIAYLEEQVATARGYNLPREASGKAADPAATAAAPGAVAAPEFWHNWAALLAPELVRKNGTRLSAIARAVGKGKPASVTYGGQALTEFKYDAAATEPETLRKQNDILLALLDAFYRASGAADTTAMHGRATVVLASKLAEDRAAVLARTAAMRYAEELKAGLRAALPPRIHAQLEDRYRFALVAELNVARKKQRLPALDASPVLLSHPRLDLFVDVDSKHPVESGEGNIGVGCTSCHDGSGQETDFVLAAHTPRDIYVDAKTGAPVLPAQLVNGQPEHDGHPRDLSSMLEAAQQADGLHLAEPATTQPSGHDSDRAGDRPIEYLDPVSGTRGRAVTQMAYWKSRYEPQAPRSFELVYHEWDWPMRTPEYIEANCARCHTEVYDIKETAPVLYEGRQLFTQLGCANCHQMDSISPGENRKVGTDLRHVTEKLSPAYINTWIWAPKAFRPTTKMPHFFMLENNSSDEEIRRTRQEARAMTEYLVRSATPLPPLHAYPAGGHGSAEAGQAIFNTIGCLACHQNLNERGEEWITTDLVKREGLAPEDAKRQYATMDYNERQHYVQEHLSEPSTVHDRLKYADGSPKPTFVQVGPELSGIGTKLTAGRTVEQARQWLFDWLKEPRHYSEYTIMPRLRLSDQQAMDLVAYLLDQKRTTNDPDDAWSAGLTPTDSAKLIELTALQLRSRYSVQTALEKADDERELTGLATTALTTPAKSAEQARAEAAQMTKDEKRLVFLGQKMIAHYGCMSCHAINGMETTSSPCTNLSDWGQKGIDKLDFGYLDEHKLHSLPMTMSIDLVNGLSADAANLGHEKIDHRDVARSVEVAWPHVGHNRNDWITQKLKNTRIFDRGRALLEPSEQGPGKPYDKLKMPTFYLNDEQVHAIVTFVISNRNRLVSERLTQKATNDEAKTIARGRELTERYNCIACHQTEKNIPQIQQYFKIDEVMTKAPPSLRGEGNKIQHAWLFNFFKHVEPLRPLLGEMAGGIRMPSFPASDEEWTAIIAYFNAVSKKESQELAQRIGPVVKYIQTQRSAATQPATQPSETGPGDDWWQLREFAVAAQALKEWGLSFGHIKPIEVGPRATPADLTKVYRTLLFKSRFTRELYDAPFPFVDAPRPELSEQQFKLGEQLFYEMQCLKCHVLGDPQVAGANKAPTAPNLSLAHRRLQYRWVRHWVQEPNIIQVGTAMPPFLTGLAINELDGQPWPASQGAALAEVQRVEARYGATAEAQARLVLDFLYAAGVHGYTGVQPAAADQQPQQENHPTTAPSTTTSDASAPASSGRSPGSKRGDG